MDKYQIANAERDRFVKLVLDSRSKKKVIVAGPGTGKTYLFKEVLKARKHSLTLTFVNALVEDLALELNGLSDVRTLHSFALYLLNDLKGVKAKIYPKLSRIIQEDERLLRGAENDFDRIFHNREKTPEISRFYETRRNYYDNYYGHEGVMLELVELLEKKREKIPVYEQIVVDEFQDFNLLEVSLIDLLAEKTPILLAGDDDQALYFWKSADPKHIRQRHDPKNTEYESFDLPFCSRSSRVIVEAINDIVTNAHRNKSLQNRVKKPYVYFEDLEKDNQRLNEQNPYIIHCRIPNNAIPWLIAKETKEIAEVLRRDFSILIISPARDKAIEIAMALEEKGFKNVSCEPKEDKECTVVEGLRILAQDKRSNLGWRILAKFIANPTELKEILEETDKLKRPTIYDTLVMKKIGLGKESDLISGIERLLQNLTSDNPLTASDVETLDKLNLRPNEIIKDKVKKEISPLTLKVPGTSKVQITATTIPGSKGLAADYVFITHFDEMFFKTADQDICNFLVALTRARKRVYLISIRESGPALLGWIDPKKVNSINYIEQFRKNKK